MDYPNQNQHHISEALLRQFAIPGEGGMVYRFDKMTRKTTKRSVRFSESSGRDFPYWSSEHESYLKKIEDSAIPLIRRLSSTEELSFGRYAWMPSILTASQREDLILFIAMLDVTGEMVRRYRSKDYDGRERIATELKSWGLPAEPSEIEALYHDIPEFGRRRIEERAAYLSKLQLQTVRVSEGLVVLPDVPVCGRFVVAMPLPWDHFVLPISPNSILLRCHSDMISSLTMLYLGKGLRETLCGEPYSRNVYSSVELPEAFRGRSIRPGTKDWGDYDDSLWNLPTMGERGSKLEE